MRLLPPHVVAHPSLLEVSVVTAAAILLALLAPGCAGPRSKQAIVSVAAVVRGVDAASVPVYRSVAASARTDEEVVRLIDGTAAGRERALEVYRGKLAKAEALRLGIDAARAAIYSAGQAIDAAGRNADRDAGALAAAALAVSALAQLPPLLRAAGVAVPSYLDSVATSACKTLSEVAARASPPLPAPCPDVAPAAMP